MALENIRLKLFIADNDENLVKSISRNIISKFGDTVEFSLSPEEAFEKVIISKPDIVITDINFSSGEQETDPGMVTAGVEFSRRIRKELPQTKIIAISGFRNNDEIFEKITEKDWYDVFHTKGGEDLYSKYAALRETVIAKSTGLIPFLSRFFSPLNHGFDPDKSFYRLLHTNYDRNENLKLLSGIKDYYSKFRSMLEISNSEFIDRCLKVYQDRDLTLEERTEVKERFHIKSNELECLFDSIRLTIYAEKNIIVDIWEKIISETKDHSNINSAVFKLELTDYQIIFSVMQDSVFNFNKFLETDRTVNIYKRIKNYGDVVIESAEKKYSIVSEKFFNTSESTEGCIIKIILNTIKAK